MNNRLAWTYRRIAAPLIAASLGCIVTAVLISLLPGTLGSVFIRLGIFLVIILMFALLELGATSPANQNAVSSGKKNASRHVAGNFLPFFDQYEKLTGHTRMVLCAILLGVIIGAVIIDVLVATLLVPLLKRTLQEAAFLTLPFGFALSLFSIATHIRVAKSSRSSHIKLAVSCICLLALCFGASLIVDTPAIPLDSRGVWAVGVSLGLFVAALTATLVATYERPVIPAPKPTPTVKTVIVKNRNADLETSCARLAERYALTKRESEVLVYLAHGRSRTHIAKDLCVSLPTVGSHVQNIYSKSGVHSVQELLDKLEVI